MTSPRARRRPLALTILVAFALTLAGSACSKSAGDESSSGTLGQGPDATASASPAAAGPTASPTGTGGGGGTPVEDLPASWTLCQNVIRGTSMGYPAAWFTTSLGANDKCSLFHPTSFTIPVAGEYPLVGMAAAQTDVSMATYLAGETDPAFQTTVLNEATTVAGKPATRFEVVSLGGGLDDPGTRRYGYVVDRGGRAFVLWTTARTGETRYSDWKFIIDTAKGTLRFL